MHNAANDTHVTDVPGCPGGRITPDEQLITLADAARCLPKVDGRKVAVSTLWRWCRRGMRGAFLDYVRVGRKICTTRRALLRFFTALAEADEHGPPGSHHRPSGKRRPLTARRRQRALADADATLERAGMLRLTKKLMNQNLILSLFTFYSPSDSDAYLRPKVTYKISDHWTVEAGGNVLFGAHDHTLFGQLRRNTNVYAALRYAF